MILGDEPGVGKTPPTIVAARELVSSGDILVVGPKVAYGVWRREVKRWVDEDVVVYAGQPGVRKSIDLKGRGWYVCNYHMLDEVLSRRPRWPLIIADESHHMANRKAGFYKAMHRAKSELMFELTGSPMVNGLADMWAQLNLLDPKKFSSYWRFINEHLYVYRGKFGMEIGRPKNPTRTKKAIEPYFLRRTKKSSGMNLPPKQRGVIEVEHTRTQDRLYTDLMKDMIAELPDGSKLMTPNQMSRITRLRQINVTPALVGGRHDSAVFEALRGKCEELFSADQNVVVFTPFTEAIPWMIEELAGLTKNMAVLQGGMTGDQIDEVVQWFQNDSLRKKVLFASIRSGTSWTATAASTCIFVGYDWTPMWNGQCEDRLHRFGQGEMVNCWYIMCRNTVDEHVMDVLDQKTSWNNLILTPRHMLRPGSGAG